ncbi:MAG TPA: response regulator transcription factor [Candidatus Binataceae bacterium]|nr:response regulator transcription factor [Candidatus Binataceae bacterium]
MKRLRILLADDHAVVIEGLRRILDRPEFEVVGVASDGWALLKTAARLQPDVIITDIAMPSLNGIEAVRKIHEQNQKPKIIFLTMHPELAYATAAFAAGASGYVLKSAAGEELISAISDVLDGRTYISKQIAPSMEHAREVGPGKHRGAIDGLTHRQREVLQLLAKGLQAKEIAATLNVSSKTVEFHKYRIMDALELRTVADLTRYAVKHGIVE